MRENVLALCVNILHGKNVVAENVRCKIYLPIKSVDDIRIKLYPSKEQHNKVKYRWKFSLEGDIRDAADVVYKTIKAENVYWVNSEDEYTHWEADHIECVRASKPTDLKITSFFRHNHYPSNISELLHKIHGSFWITSHPLFQHFWTSEPLEDGGFSIKTHRQSRFTLAEGFQLTFRHRERSYKDDNGDTVIFSEPVLEFELGEEKSSLVGRDDLHVYINDFLVLASFAGRQRSMCVGWDIHHAEGSTNFYRRDISIPTIKDWGIFRDEIITPEDFEEFMRVAYRKFSEIKQNEYLRRAINFAIPKDSYPVESYYMLLFAALETLISYFRLEGSLEEIIPSSVVKSLKIDFNRWLDSQPLLEINPEDRDKKRDLIRDKFSELNRVSFNTAFKKFLEVYSVDLSDLWPMTENKGGPSLYQIRNKLVHGAPFSHRQELVFDCAIENLKWSVERMILSILGWPIERTNLRPQYLSGMTMYKEWRERRERLQ